MLRRTIPALLAAAMVLTACGGAGPAISDPREIMTQGLEATAELTSAHVLIEVDGSATIPELGGGSMNLSGTSLEGDLDIENSEAHFTFDVRSLITLGGELIMVGEDTYLKTSMTGPMWVKSTAAAGDPVSEVTDPTKALAQVRAFLDEDGVELEKLDDADCGDGSCYALRLTVPAAVLADAGDATDMDPGDLIGDELVLDLLFDREDLWLTEISTELGGESVGQLTLRVTLSDFNDDVSIEAPPADEVTEDGGSVFPF